MPESIPCTLAIAAKALQPWITNTISRVTGAADCILILLLGYIAAAFMVAFVLYVMSLLINLMAAPWNGGQTVGQIVAKSLGKTMGGIAAAWKEG